MVVLKGLRLLSKDLVLVSVYEPGQEPGPSSLHIFGTCSIGMPNKFYIYGLGLYTGCCIFRVWVCTQAGAELTAVPFHDSCSDKVVFIIHANFSIYSSQFHAENVFTG